MSKGKAIKHLLVLVIEGTNMCDIVTETKQHWRRAGCQDGLESGFSDSPSSDLSNLPHIPSAILGVSSNPLALWGQKCARIYVSWVAATQNAFGPWNFPVLCKIALCSYKEQYINLGESKRQENKIRSESGQCNSLAVSLKKIRFLSKGFCNSFFQYL